MRMQDIENGFRFSRDIALPVSELETNQLVTLRIRHEFADEYDESNGGKRTAFRPPFRRFQSLLSKPKQSALSLSLSLDPSRFSDCGVTLGFLAFLPFIIMWYAH